MSAVISMRLHGLIFSSVSGVPLVGVSYDPKIGSFLDYLHCGTCLGLEDVTAEKLMQATDSAVSLIPEREQLKANANRLKSMERKNIEAVERLLRSETKQ